MSSDAILFFQQFPKMIWGLFNSVDIPGLGFTPGALIWGIVSFPVIVWVINNIFNFGGNLTTKVSNRRDRGES